MRTDTVIAAILIAAVVGILTDISIISYYLSNAVHNAFQWVFK
jgi:ABC-type nitrate/sulfonate/bicarbonate transport system permease component